MITTIIVLSLIGIVAIIAELVIPGGILGIIGGGCFLAAIIMTFANYGAKWGILVMLILIAFSIVAIWIWMKHFHRLPFTRELVLHEEVGNDDELEEIQTFVGKTGEAVTNIQPSGHALVEGQKLDVMTDGVTIEKGSSIKIVEVRGPSIFVLAD